MNNRDRTGGTEDPRSLVDQLRLDLAQHGNDDVVLPERLTDNELWAEKNLRGAEIGCPASVTAAVDALIPPREPSLEARARMINAADRALADRRALRGLLPVLLRIVRLQHRMSVSDVASRASLPKDKVRELEAGERVVDRNLSTDDVAHWISAVPVGRQQAVNALRKSLQATWRDDAVLAAGSSEVPANVDEYVAHVIKKLDHLATKGPQRAPLAALRILTTQPWSRSLAVASTSPKRKSMHTAPRYSAYAITCSG
jgi:hypothetical protein